MWLVNYASYPPFKIFIFQDDMYGPSILPQFLFLWIMVQCDEWSELFRCSFHQLAEVGSVDRRQDLHVDQLPLVFTPYCVLVYLNHLGNWRGGRAEELKGGKEKKEKNKQHTHTPLQTTPHMYIPALSSEIQNVWMFAAGWYFCRAPRWF